MIALGTGELKIGLGDVFSLLFGGGDETSVEYMLISRVRPGPGCWRRP